MKQEREQHSILITDTSPFYVKDLIHSLLEAGYKIRILFKSKRKANLFLKNFNNKNVSAFFGDILNRDTIRGITKNIDYIIHTYEFDDGFSTEEDYIYYNLKPLKNILYFSRNIKKFIFISTTEIYGKSKSFKHIFREGDSCNPFSYFGKAKLLCESFILAKKHMPSLIFRIPKLVGGQYNKEFLDLINFIRQGNIRYVNDERNRLEFIHYKDLIRALILGLRLDETGVFNLCTDEFITQSNFYKKIAEKLNVSFSFKYITSTLAMLTYKIREILKTKNDFGLSPSMAKFLSTDLACSNEKIKEKLIFKNVYSIHDIISELVEEFNNEKI